MNKNEFLQTLNSPLDYWGTKDAEDVKDLLGDEVSAMVGFNQRNPHHCYDLFGHSLHAVQELHVENDILKTSAFFHDIGKPDVAMEKNERLVFYGHAKKSAEIVKPLLYNLGYTKEEIKKIKFLISHHDDFISWCLPEEDYDKTNKFLVPITTEKLSGHISKFSNENLTIEMWKCLLLLCKADIMSQADQVFIDGKLVDTKEHKLSKIDRLMSVINEL